MKFIPTTKEDQSKRSVISRFLNPGDFYFGDSNCQIHTVLGSCVAITLWHPILHIGGMCHFILPGRRMSDRVRHGVEELNGRYADEAIILFEEAMLKYGTNLSEYEAKIFGGSSMTLASRIQEEQMVGLRNIEAALKHLFEKEISLKFAHIGETGHRRIVFDVENGDVWVKYEPLKKKTP